AGVNQKWQWSPCAFNGPHVHNNERTMHAVDIVIHTTEDHKGSVFVLSPNKRRSDHGPARVAWQACRRLHASLRQRLLRQPRPQTVRQNARAILASAQHTTADLPANAGRVTQNLESQARHEKNEAASLDSFQDLELPDCFAEEKIPPHF